MTDVFKPYHIDPVGPINITLPRSPDPACLFTVIAAKSDGVAVMTPDGRQVGRLAPGQRMVVGWRKGAYRRIWDGRPWVGRKRRSRAAVRPKGDKHD